MHKLTKQEKNKRENASQYGQQDDEEKNCQHDAQPEGLGVEASQAILEYMKKSASVPSPQRHPQACVPRRHKIKRHRDRFYIWSGSTMDEPTTPITRCDKARVGKHSMIYHI